MLYGTYTAVFHAKVDIKMRDEGAEIQHRTRTSDDPDPATSRDDRASIKGHAI
jgi:hypothetical protein